MSSGNEILYIKGEKNTEVKEPNVTLGDILTMECSNSSIMNRIKPLRILKIPKKEHSEAVCKNVAFNCRTIAPKANCIEPGSLPMKGRKNEMLSGRELKWL